MTRLVLLLMLLVISGAPAWAADEQGEYKVVILQGFAGGAQLEKQEQGLYVDAKRTRLLNELAAEGWEVVSVVGASGADHTVYLRRKNY